MRRITLERQPTRHNLTMRLLAVALLLSAPPLLAQPCEYWVAPPPAGDDAHPGTLASPWATLDHASASVPDDTCTVVFKDGVYTGTHSLYERFATPTTFKAQNRYRAVLEYAGTVVKLFGSKNLTIEGFEIRHTGPGAGALVMQVQQASPDAWAENVTIRDNVFHDSWNNDLLKINNGARFITVEGNVFYNQAGSDEHIDINSVTDVLVQDNVFFNDFEGSGRVNGNDTSSFIVMKDSNAGDDGQIGDERITVRRNVFLNWEGSSGSNFTLVGEDGMPYFEGRSILVENNLMIGNANNDMRAAFGVKGGKDITFRANTVVGDLPSLAFACRVNQEGSNPVNENVAFRGNIWSDPTGTMGAEAAGGTNEFSDGTPAEVTGLVLDRNLYWNGGAAIPPGDLVSPLVDDADRVVADPQLPAQGAIVLPRWNGTSFVSGSATIRQEFERLVGLYGAISAASPAADASDALSSPTDDILGRPRGWSPDLGAYEADAAGMTIHPSSGDSAGGAGVAITGSSFADGATVSIGGAAAADASVSSASFVTATSPALPPGTLNDVVVTNPDHDVLDARGRLALGFPRRPAAGPVSSLHRDALPVARFRRLSRGEVLPRRGAASGADGGSAAESRARPESRAASGVRNRLRRRPGVGPLRAVDRGALHTRHHRRLRRRKLLPGRDGHASADGRVSAEDQVRQRLRPARGGRHFRRRSGLRPLRPVGREPVCRGGHGRLPGEPAALLPVRPKHEGQMAVFLVRAFGL